jgi:glycerate 2-kinase
MNPERLLTTTLRSHPAGRALAEIMAAALDAVDPAVAVRRHLKLDGAAVLVGDRRYEQVGRVFVIGAGKAGAPMAQAALDKLGARVAGGLVVVKEGHLGDTEIERQGDRETSASGNMLLVSSSPGLAVLEAGHPLPDERGARAAEQIAHRLGELREDDLVLVLLSGGGSALLTWPAPGLALADLQAMTAALLRCGATIGEINALRKHTTRLFGGQLARLAQPAQVAALIVSDVVGSPLDVIASGPTSPDPTTFADAWAVVERYDLESALPAALLEHLRHGVDGVIDETPKLEDELWARVHNIVVASNSVAAEAAVAAARAHGFDTLLLTTYLEGEAREVGRVAAGLARELALRNAPLRRPALVVAGGETTVTLRGDGLGGRNQELALGAAQSLAGLHGALVVALATDGGDGPTDAAGAVASGDTLARADALGVDAGDHLRRNDAYRFFAALGDLLLPGPTLTNVNDLLFVAALEQ